MTIGYQAVSCQALSNGDIHAWLYPWSRQPCKKDVPAWLKPEQISTKTPAFVASQAATYPRWAELMTGLDAWLR